MNELSGQNVNIVPRNKARFFNQVIVIYIKYFNICPFFIIFVLDISSQLQAVPASVKYWAFQTVFYQGLEVRGWAVVFERYYMDTRVLIVQTWLPDLLERHDCAPIVIPCLCKPFWLTLC